MKLLYILSASLIFSTSVLQAQQNVGIGTSTPNPNALLHVDLGLSTSKGFLISGNYDAASTVPNLGAGSRLLFFPGKAAFRSGRVFGTEWDNVNVGLASVAMGSGTTASGINASAFGYQTTATGNYATSMGFLTNATGNYAISSGQFTNAIGGMSTALGLNTVANATASTSMGQATKASGYASTAMGYSTTATEWGSTSMGNSTDATGYASTATGFFSKAKGYASTVVGMYNDSILSNNEQNFSSVTPMFIVGNGNDANSRSNAMVVLKNGNVGIGSNASVSSALLDLSSTTKGFLMPRMTSSQRIAIASPVAGLMVYETDTKLNYQHDGTAWRKLLNSSFWNSSDTRAFVYNTTDSIGIGTSTPSEKLHISNGQIRLSRSSSFENDVVFNMPAATIASEHEGLKFQLAGTDKAFIGYSSNSLSPSVLRLSGNGTFANDLTISATGRVGIGTNDPQEKFHVAGNMIMDGTNQTLQLQNSGVDKGFIQLAGDDIRIGTNSSNTNGKFIVRTSGVNQLEVDGTNGINVLKLYAAGAHKGSITTSTNDNVTINTVNSNSQLQLNNEVYINISSSRTGFGTPNPEEKVHVSGGNLKITSGSLLKNTTGAFDMMPLCYGRINANGSIYAATPNVSINRTSAGTYEITCSGITASSVISVTVYGSTRFIGSGEYVSAGKMKVTIENIKEVIDDPNGFHANDDKTFYFVIYN